MRKYLIGGTIAGALFATAAMAATWTDTIHWGWGGVERAKEWVSPDGRISMQAVVQPHTALDMWPAWNTPTEHSLTELTLNRFGWWEEGHERINLSAMVDESDGGAYRIGIEAAPPGIHRPLIVCFETWPAGGVAFCPFKIDTTGTYALHTDGVYYRVLTEADLL